MLPSRKDYARKREFAVTVVAVTETQSIMKKIDSIINTHGG